MKTVTTANGAKVTYNDETAYAFSPCVVKVVGIHQSAVLTVNDTGGTSFAISSDSYGGVSMIDFRELVQSHFDTMIVDNDYENNYVMTTEMGKELNCSIEINYENGAVDTVEWDDYFIWGALHTAEEVNNFHTLHYFNGFPFSIGVYAYGEDGLGFESSQQGGIVEKYAIPQRGLWQIGALEWLFKDTIDGERCKMWDTTEEIGEITIIAHKNAGEGYYLRWIDRHGMLRYFLFKAGDSTREVTGDGEFMRNNLEMWDAGYRGKYGRRQNYGRSDTIKLCAPLVDSETFDMLQDIATSPIVDLYQNGGTWIGVTIKAGSYTKTGAVLQDFECQMITPEYMAQSL